MLAKNKYFPFLLFLLGLVVIELIIDPIGEFALNDDWAYARSVHVWNETGTFAIGKWPAMSLFSHSLLGLAFVKIFGFSYTALRFSNMFLCVITLFYLYKFLSQRSGTKLAVFICSVIVLNPFYLNLFNTYMTDLTFINFTFLAFYALVNYLENGKKIIDLFLFFVFALLATFTRQIGVILFFSLILIGVVEWMKNRNYVLSISAVFFTGITLCLLYFFERQQDQLTPKDAAYQGLFFNKADVKLDMSSLIQIAKRTVIILIYSGSVYLIIGSLFLRDRINELRKNSISKLIMLGIAIALFFWILKDFPVGNVLFNCGLGPESTIDIIYLLKNMTLSTSDFLYKTILSFFLLGFLLWSQVVNLKTIKRGLRQINSLQLFMIAVLFLYSILIGISEAFMDRYALFFIVFLIVLVFLKPIGETKLNYVLPCILLVYIGSFSVFANRDYLKAAHVKQKAYKELLENKIKVEVIHAGFEYELWDGTLHDFDWYNFDHYYDREFVLSRGPIENFETFKTYAYQRCIPFKMDTFFVLKKKTVTPI